MEQETNQVVPLVAPKMVIGWQTVGIVAGMVLLFLLLSYFLYRFITHTNKRFKNMEQAIHNLSEQSKQQQHPTHSPPVFVQHQQAKPIPVKPQPIPVPVQIPVPMPVPTPPPPTPVVVADSKTLDKELMEELKELKEVVVETEPATEGRVE